VLETDRQQETGRWLKLRDEEVADSRYSLRQSTCFRKSHKDSTMSFSTTIGVPVPVELTK
jgi:hypothetical protein